MDWKKQIFWCHSSKDKSVVRTLSDRMKSMGYKCFFDENNLKQSMHIEKTIFKGIRESDYFVTCYSANLLTCDYALKEMEYCKSLKESEIKIVPVQIEILNKETIDEIKNKELPGFGNHMSKTFNKEYYQLIEFFEIQSKTKNSFFEDLQSKLEERINRKEIIDSLLAICFDNLNDNSPYNNDFRRLWPLKEKYESLKVNLDQIDEELKVIISSLHKINTKLLYTLGVRN